MRKSCCYIYGEYTCKVRTEAPLSSLGNQAACLPNDNEHLYSSVKHPCIMAEYTLSGSPKLKVHYML